ncbi:MAG: hypothetical protein KJO23_05240 [Bacteroidia bacterium]|nr:hypothetical protein [Bacteroidia bacterium]
MVQTLLDELADCKKTKTETETRIAFMESNPGNYTLAQYLSAKEFLKDLKNCIKSNRAQLERLRKDYPEWFNSPSAFTDLRLSPPRLRNPPEMEDAIRELQEALDDMTNRFADLVQPEH